MQGRARIGQPGRNWGGRFSLAALRNRATIFQGDGGRFSGYASGIGTPILLREVETDTGVLVQLATDMDDLALQFDGTDVGKRFIEAWKCARIIVDTGGGHSGTPPTPPTPPAIPGK